MPGKHSAEQFIVPVRTRQEGFSEKAPFEPVTRRWVFFGDTSQKESSKVELSKGLVCSRGWNAWALGQHVGFVTSGLFFGSMIHGSKPQFLHLSQWCCQPHLTHRWEGELCVAEQQLFGS